MDDRRRAFGFGGKGPAKKGASINLVLGAIVSVNLVQIDGSEHWWFEDRGPQSTLLVYVDDATSRLMHLRFCRDGINLRLLPGDP